MKYTWLCFLDYNLVKNYKNLFPKLQSKKENYKGLLPRLQSKNEKDNALSMNQNLDSGARLQNRKVLDTHSTQTKSSLLDSK